MFKFLCVVSIVFAKLQCVNLSMLHICTSLHQEEIFCEFDNVGEYTVSQSEGVYEKVRSINFGRLTDSWVDASMFPALTNLTIGSTAFDRLTPCQHIIRQHQNVNVTFGTSSKICVSIFIV